MHAMREAPMRNVGSESRSRLVVGFAVLALTVAAWWMWQGRQTSPVAARVGPPPPFVRMIGAGEGKEDKVLQDRAKFFDPTPLFVPSAQNYGHAGLPERLKKQPGHIFGEYDAKFYPDGFKLPPLGSTAATAPESLGDILARANEVPFAGLGELEVRRQPLPERVAHIEIKSLQGEQLTQEHSVTDANPPRGGFAPMEFLVVVGPAGLIGDPLLLTGSGFPEVDVFFREYLVSGYRLGVRLPPGRYRVRVGP